MSFPSVLTQAKQYYPDFASELVGISADEWERFKKLVGRAVPKDYEDFLKSMGKSQGRIKAYREIDISFDSIEGAYRRLQRAPKSSVRREKAIRELVADYDDYFLFGLDKTGNDNGDFFLNARKPELPVVELTDTYGAIPRSPSFAEFIFRDTFPALFK